MDDELRYTDEAELNRYLFYGDINEINFFVEDKNKEYEYETILNKLFQGRYKIASIITANGKLGVKQAFREFGEKGTDYSAGNNFYIVDGDFDKYIHSEDMIDNSHFIYLKKYNIENYFIDEKSVIKFAKGKLHVLDKNVQSIINFTYWRDTIIEQAKKLFLLYCAVQKVLPSEPNVARSEYLFIDDKTGFERLNGYKSYYDYIVTIKSNIDSDIEDIKVIYESENGTDYSGFICGKFLLTSLYVYLRGKTKKKFTKDELRWALICDIDVSGLNFIKESVDSICHN